MLAAIEKERAYSQQVRHGVFAAKETLP